MGAKLFLSDLWTLDPLCYGLNGFKQFCEHQTEVWLCEDNLECAKTTYIIKIV